MQEYLKYWNDGYLILLPFLAAFRWVFWDTKELKEDLEGRKAYQGYMSWDGGLALYRRVLEGILDWLDTRLSRREADLPAEHRARAWSFGLFNLTLGVALAYPILMLMLKWGLSNDGTIAGLMVQPPEEGWLRAMVFAGLAGFAFCFRMGVVKSDLVRLAWFSAGLGLLLAGAIAFVVAVALIVAVAVAGAFPGAFAVAVAGAFTGAVAVTLVGNAVVAGVFAVESTFAVAVAFVVAVAVAGAVAVVFAVAGSIFFAWLGERTNRATYFSVIWVVFLLASLGLAISFLPKLETAPNDTEAAALILFLCIFPILNGLTDFTSIGATRYYLRKGLSGPPLKYAALDILLAVGIFLVLGCLLIALIHVVRPQDGKALLDLPRLLAEIQDPDTRGEYWWLGFMLFSVVVPTLLHGALALMVGLTQLVALCGNFLAPCFAETASVTTLNRGRFGVAVLAGMSLSGVLALGWWLFFNALPGAEGGLGLILRLFTGFAHLIGVFDGSVPEIANM